MKPPAFDYVDPKTLPEALEMLARFGEDAKILAGGQTLAPLLNMRLASPAVLIDINGISALDYRRAEEKCLAIGALTRESALEDDPGLAATQPMVALALPHIAHRAIRNRGTVGGSLAYADPAAEWPALVTLLEAELVLESLGQKRVVRAEDFFITHLTTTLAPVEILSEIRLPAAPPGAGYAMLEFSRRHGDFALAGVMVRLWRDQAGRLADPRLTLFGVGPRPVRARRAEAALAFESPRAGLFSEAAAIAATEIAPYSDLHASAEYRRHLAEVLARRALDQASARIGGGRHE
ncbi:MAG: FAD binding domain-containing protein [Acetobacteraceae bacterium]